MLLLRDVARLCNRVPGHALPSGRAERRSLATLKLRRSTARIRCQRAANREQILAWASGQANARQISRSIRKEVAWE